MKVMFAQLVGRIWPSVIITLLGSIALSILIWLAGPMMSVKGYAPFEILRVRVLTIAGLFVFWLLAWLVIWLINTLLRRWANAKLVDGMMRGDNKASNSKKRMDGASQEIASLDARFRESIAHLRTLRVTHTAGPGKTGKSGGAGKRRSILHGKRYLYELPWYLVIGAPGTGKTTALLHSGLRFGIDQSNSNAPVRANATANANADVSAHAMRGVGGTRQCDWWFSEEAVLLDTAGRYTTQDSDPKSDKIAWQGFLDLLRRYRKRQPLNGVMVVLSTEILLSPDPDDIARHARLVAARLQELRERLGLALPAYLVLTKCDRLAGFIETFGELSKEAREQVWGHTVALDPMSSHTGPVLLLETFNTQFTALTERLRSHVIDLMQAQPQLRKRAAIYEFPEQFAGLGEPLGRFIDALCAQSHFRDEVWLRGFYFTSGTQDGRPIDRAMSAIAMSLSHSSRPAVVATGTARAYFITRLLRDIMFSEAGLAGSAPAAQRRYRLLLRGGVSLALLAGVGSSAYLMQMGWHSERRLRADATNAVVLQHEARQLSAGPSATLAWLPLLDAAAKLAQASAQASVLARFGLSQEQKVAAEADTVYRGLLKQTVLPQSVQYLETTLQPAKQTVNIGASLPNVAALRTYLMLGDAHHFNSASVLRYLLSPKGLATTLSSLGNTSPATSSAMSAAPSGTTRGTTSLATETKAAAPITQIAALSSHLDALFAPGKFNADVELNQTLIQNTRLDMKIASATSSIWTPVLAELQRENLAPFSVIDIAGDTAQLLFVRPSGKSLSEAVDGPFTAAAYPRYKALRAALLQNTDAETWVTGETNGSHDAAALGSALDQQYAQAYIAAWDDFLNDFVVARAANLDQAAKIAALLSGPDSAMRKVFMAVAVQLRLPAGAVGDQVQAHFAEFLNYVDLPPVKSGAAGASASAASAGPTPLEKTLVAMKEVASYLTAAGIAQQTGLPAPPDGAVARLNATMQGAPAAATATAGAVGEAGPALLRGDAYLRINALWQNTVGPACRLALDGRYPLVSGATQTVAVDDFARVFATGGLLDSFFQTQLAPLVDSTVTPWRWRKDAVPEGTDNGALQAFERAAAIRDAYFPNGSRTVSFHFSMVPITLAPNLITMNFDFGGLHWDVGTALQPAEALDWPTDEPTDHIRISTNPAGFSFDQGGLWAVLRMFDAGDLQTTKQADQFVLHLGGHSAFKVIARSVVNPLNPELVHSFRCPGNI